MFRWIFQCINTITLALAPHPQQSLNPPLHFIIIIIIIMSGSSSNPTTSKTTREKKSVPSHKSFSTPFVDVRDEGQGFPHGVPASPTLQKVGCVAEL